MTTAPKFEKFSIHGLAAEGLTVTTRAVTDINADGVTLYPGDTLEVSEDIYRLNLDRDGNSWLDLDDDGQVARWGKRMFGLGEVPGHVTAELEDQRHAKLAAELDQLKRLNPHVAKASAATIRARELEAELGISR